MDAALKKGDLKFTLEGVKLKGSWVLVRTKGGGWGARSSGGGDRSWLLIKHRDDWAGPVDIAEFAPLSVKSQGDFADILASGNPDIWQSHRPAQGGEAGALFERIIERALAMRNQRTAGRSESAGGSGGVGSKRARGSLGSRSSRAPQVKVKKTATVRRSATKAGNSTTNANAAKRSTPATSKNPRARRASTRRPR